jgi:soluble lytic murein transglycosylase-like protein
MDYRELARQIAIEERIDPDLFERLVQHESGFQPDVRSSAGAYGLTQLMPGTAADLGVDPTDPIQNLRGGARYLRQQLDAFGDTNTALAAYNAGPGNVRKYGGIPPFKETQNYVNIIGGGYTGEARLPVRPRSRPQDEDEFARGYEAPRQVQDLYDNSPVQKATFDVLSVYNPYEIAERFRLKR